MKTGKRKTTKEIELPKQGRIRTLGKKENYKYFRILEANTIKREEMKGKKNKKRVLQKKKEVSRNQYLPKKSFKRDKHPGSLPCKILWTILKTNKRNFFFLLCLMVYQLFLG